jgi:arylsulfatase A-like enzyme
MKDSMHDWSAVLPAGGTPSVLYIVLDDVGISALKPYGGLSRRRT